MTQIYHDLAQMKLPEEMRPVERRQLDLVFEVPDQPPRIFEFDETQHFNHFRALTLDRYDGVPVAFDVAAWRRECSKKKRLEGGGFGAPKPPLFPGVQGRHKQRAFRDALADILPPEHGYLPTLRIAFFEVESWLSGTQCAERMEALLHAKGIG